MPVQNTKPSDYPQAVIQQIDLLAQNIVVARKRRKETQAQWALRLGVSQPTMARIEKGDPSVAMASYVMCVWLINPGASMANLIAPQHDIMALEREVAKFKPRARSPKKAEKQVSRNNVTPASPPTSAIESAQVTKKSAQDEIHKLQTQQSAAEAVMGSGIGGLGALQKLRAQQSTAEAALGLDVGASRTAAGLAALIAKAQGTSK